jgi:hypothetical protein
MERSCDERDAPSRREQKAMNSQVQPIRANMIIENEVLHERRRTRVSHTSMTSMERNPN